jgi:hypothetical protein
VTTEGTSTDTALVARPVAPELTPYEVIERVIASGDLTKMDPPSRVAFYWRTCESLGLNPLTRPFEYIVLDGKMTLYARKDCTDQLRALNRVSITGLRQEINDALGLLTVFAHGRTTDGREEESSGVVSIKGFQGQALGNLFMKAETKAKRRLTLSLVGLGFLDESEVEGGTAVHVDHATGEITEGHAAPSLLEQVQAQAQTYTAPAEATVILVTQVDADQADQPASSAPVIPVEPVEQDQPDQAVSKAPVDVPEPAEPVSSPIRQIEPDQAPPVTQVDPVDPARPVSKALTLVEFSERLTTSGLDRDKVRAQVKLLFPDATRFGELTPEQLATVWDAIAPAGAQAAPAAQGEPVQVLAAPMTPEASAAVAPSVCGAQSPYGDAVCLLEPDHHGAHRASDSESW